MMQGFYAWLTWRNGLEVTAAIKYVSIPILTACLTVSICTTHGVLMYQCTCIYSNELL